MSEREMEDLLNEVFRKVVWDKPGSIGPFRLRGEERYGVWHATNGGGACDGKG